MNNNCKSLAIQKWSNATSNNGCCEKVLAVKISQTYNPTNFSSNSFYEQVAGDWKLSAAEIKDVHYVLIVHQKVILEIYEVAHWTQKMSDKRWVFRGQPVLRAIPQKAYPGHPFASLIGQNIDMEDSCTIQYFAISSPEDSTK